MFLAMIWILTNGGNGDQICVNRVLVNILVVQTCNFFQEHPHKCHQEENHSPFYFDFIFVVQTLFCFKNEFQVIKPGLQILANHSLKVHHQEHQVHRIIHSPGKAPMNTCGASVQCFGNHKCL
jgi:hypothetical protein